MLLAGALELPRHLADDRALRFFDRDVARHELKNIGARGRALQRHHADALVADDDLHAFLHAVEFGRLRPLRDRIDNDGAVHQRRLDFHFAIFQLNESLLVGRDVKSLRINAVGWRRGQLHTLSFHHLGAVLPEPQDEFVEFVGAGRGDLNPSKTLIRPLLANPDFADLKGASAGDDFIEHLRQNERIDDVAAQFDGLGRHRRNLAKERDGAS